MTLYIAGIIALQMYPGRRFALPWAISLCPVGANDPVEKTRGLSQGFFKVDSPRQCALSR